jgi:acetyltransferase-like isoleucine patch superfamily enzyme
MRMNRSTWIPVAVGLALVAAVSVYALQNNQGLTADGEQGAPILAFGTPKVEVPAGTPVSVVLQTSLTTKSTNAGDHFSARVAQPVVVGGKIAIPEGAAVHGHVVLAEQPGKASGRGRLQLAYDRIEFDGHGYDVDSRSQVYVSRSGTGKDAKLIGGGAVAGGVIGAILGGSAKDAGKGALVGAAAGTGASLATRGPQLELGAGSTLRFSLDRDVTVRPSDSA